MSTNFFVAFGLLAASTGLFFYHWFKTGNWRHLISLVLLLGMGLELYLLSGPDGWRGPGVIGYLAVLWIAFTILGSSKSEVAPQPSSNLESAAKGVDPSFEYCPVHLMEIDMKAARVYLNDLMTNGSGLPNDLEKRMEIVKTCENLTRIVKVNKQSRDFLSHLGKGFYTNFSEEGRALYFKGLLAFLDGETEFSFETDVLSPRRLSVHVQCGLIPEPYGQSDRIVVSFRDNTELRQAAKQIEESEARYRDLFENSSDLIQGVDPSGKVIYANTAWKQTLGHDVGVNMGEFIHPDSMDHCMKVFGQLMKGEDVGRVEAVFVSKDGREITAEGNLSCRFLDGKPYMTRGIFRDISTRRRIEENLKMNQEITTSSIHNIGNVLASINNSIQLIRENIKQSKAHNLLKAIGLMNEHRQDLAIYFTDDPKGKILPEFMSQAGDKLGDELDELGIELSKLLTKIALINKISKPQQTLNRADASSIWADAVTIINTSLESQIAGAKRVRVAKTIDLSGKPMLPFVATCHVLMNLIKNAVEALVDVDEPVLELTADMEEEQLRLVVRDNGSGIDEAHLPSMFSHGFTTKDTGHGFGLSYCARMVKESGGDIKVKNSGKGGAEFTVLLPYKIEEKTG